MPEPQILDSVAHAIVLAAQVADDSVRLVGGAGLGLLLGHRRSDDVDLFVPRGSELRPIVDAVTASAVELGGRVESVRTTPSFVRLQVVHGSGALPVDIANDPSERLAAAEMREGLKVESLRDQRANKLVALLGRSELRDLVDLYFIEKAGLTAVEGCADALTKDAGVDFAWLAWAAQQVRLASPPGMIAPLDLAQLSAFRDRLCDALLDRAGASE